MIKFCSDREGVGVDQLLIRGVQELRRPDPGSQVPISDICNQEVYLA
jgi:hypothetical protein